MWDKVGQGWEKREQARALTEVLLLEHEEDGVEELVVLDVVIDDVVELEFLMTEVKGEGDRARRGDQLKERDVKGRGRGKARH
jgi:hypothetical protein